MNNDRDSATAAATAAAITALQGGGTFTNLNVAGSPFDVDQLLVQMSHIQVLSLLSPYPV